MSSFVRGPGVLLVLLLCCGAVQTAAGSKHCSVVGGNATGAVHHTGRNHTSLFPITWHDGVGGLLSILFAAFANAGGIGGGGLFVPLLILIFGLKVHYAIPLSKVMVFGGALTRFLSTLRARHPTADRPAIDYDIVLVFQPIILVGTTAGVMLNTVLPESIILLLLALLLAFTTFRTTCKGVRMWRQETASFTWKRVRNEGAEDGPGTPIPPDNSRDDIELVGSGGENGTNGAGKKGDPDLLRILARMRRQWPWQPIVVVACVWASVIVLSLLRGGHGAPSMVGIAKCSSGYWLLVAASGIIAVGVTLMCGRWMRQQHNKKVALGFEFHDGDVQWSLRNTLLHPCLCFLAGVAAGLLGIGGGLVLGPLFLEMGLRPQVSAGTSSFMVLFTSSATSLQFLILGQLRLDYAGFLLPFCFFGAFLGVIVVKRVVRKYGRTSVIVFALAVVMGTSGVLIPSFGIVGVIKDFSAGADPFQVASFCGCT